jgi:hypothetical protein
MILFQRSRILIDVIDESLQEEFIKKNTIYEKNMSFGYNEKWTSIAEVEYNGNVYIALPRSYPIQFAKKYALDTTCKLDNSFDSYETCDIKLKQGVTYKNDIQKLLSDFLYGRNTYKEILNKPRRALFADTGIGKTFLTINNICETNLKTIIFCPDDRAIKTWKEELLKFTDLHEDEILYLKCVSNIKKAIKNKNKYKIVLFSINTASSMFSNNNIDEFTEFMSEFKFGLKVFDEMHLRLKSIFFIDMYTNTFKTIYLTATNNMRIYGEQKVMEYMTPSEDCVYLQEPVKKFELIKFIYHTTPSNYTEVSKRIQKVNGFDANEYLKYLFRDEPVTEFYLNNVIKPVYNHALKLIKEENQKVAILFKSIESGKIVGNYIQTLYPDLKIGYFNSEIKDMKIREKELDCNLIISTDKSFSGILNIYNLSVIILSTPITSIAHIKQIMGRLREEPNKRRIVMQLCDNTFKKAKDMLYRQTKTCEPVTTSIKEYFINQPTIKTKVEIDD